MVGTVVVFRENEAIMVAVVCACEGVKLNMFNLQDKILGFCGINWEKVIAKFTGVGVC